MRLKQIKLAGFKSFVDATTVPFPDQMTAIVGPNGCGKSNVIDAVRWVLGESSAKNLRGDAMTDVIFNGSTNRKPVSQASVELVFDNAEGRLQGNLASRNEISVKRQVNKEAQSTYFLNGSKCRRRDITDIFLGTGLGPRSYAIIEQGMISRLIESKPQELRIFIEEAAGISKYKERRRETENRIKHTRDNLDRLEDVREELGAQLEKLKRQAATARRFKELKAKERQYKAELYALKWHKYNEQLNLYEKETREKETQLEAFISEQRGGELGMLELKQQQQTFNDEVQQTQQKMYQVGNHITRLEQQIVFSQEKQSNQQQELEQLKETLVESNEHLAYEQDRQEELLEQLDGLEPEQEILEETLLEVNEQVVEFEQQHSNWQQQWDAQQKVASNSQQNVQVTQTKIQGLNSQIERLKQRQLDLGREIQDLDADALAQQQADLHNSLQQLLAQVEKHSELHQQHQSNVNNAEQNAANIKKELDEVGHQLTQKQLKYDSLLEWKSVYDRSNADIEQELQKAGLHSSGALLAQIKVATKWQHALETLLSHHGVAYVTDQLPNQQQQGQFVVNSTLNKTVGSVAELIDSGVYPAWLNRVAVTDNSDDIAELLQRPEFDSVLTQQGLWCGENWQSKGSIDQSGNVNVLQRLTEIEQLAQEIEMLTETKNTVSVQYEQSVAVFTENKRELQQVESDLSELKQTQSEHELQKKLVAQQHQQVNALIAKLEQEQIELTEQVELDQERIFELEQELELTQEQSLELDDALLQLEESKQTIVNQLNNAKQQLDGLKNQKHQLELKFQGVKSQCDGAAQNIMRTKQHQQQIQLKLSELEQSLSGSDDPVAEFKLELEEQLQLRLEVEEVLIEKQNGLAEISEKISQLEQGQSGILAKLDSMRSEIESIKLDSEGARIRAQNMLEALNDMEQPLKPVLESMPAEANEQDWSEGLEKATNSISRLGAINLAAIEEYDVQAERKGYLDEQYQDLTNALDTLESAIRKIDRESRAKFKETYDKVNSGLQELFPKVFGGGSAYLELTADDMLETGVTIMARPPGKKNSTIHLLSGGEKALTALSLVFSIFRLNPAPFCMLDEVDAPLDDANVGRFCKLVKEMSETVQFIYISHNKVAMEMATHLTGVTMQEPGVSRLVAVDIQEAVKMAEAS